LMNAPIGVIAIIGAFRYIPDDRARGRARPDLDPVGTILLCVAILGIMLPFLERGVSVLVWLSFPARLLVLGVCWVSSRHDQRPGGRRVAAHLRSSPGDLRLRRGLHGPGRHRGDYRCRRERGGRVQVAGGAAGPDRPRPGHALLPEPDPPPELRGPALRRRR